MKFSVILSNLGSCSDRYVGGGYSPAVSLKELFERFERLDGAEGVELVGTWHVSEENMPLIQDEVRRLNTRVAAIIPDHFGTAQWGKGAFTAPDAAIRALAVDETLAMCRFGRELGCRTVSIWNGQDGYDYPLQADYAAAREQLVNGIAEVAAQAPDMRISLEYKPKEPRNRCFIPNVADAILTASRTGCGNVGVTVDVGHAFEAGENVAESVVMAAQSGRLMHLHINDNHGLWDDDMITGSVHTVEYIELFYWLRRIGYDGFLSIDQYPYRENALDAAQESLNWMKAFARAAERIDMERMADILRANDAVRSTRYLRELLFDK